MKKNTQKLMVSYGLLLLVILALSTVIAIYVRNYYCVQNFGVPYNTKRRALKVPVIPGYWHIKSKDRTCTWWMGEEMVIGHESKRVTYFNCEIDGETDLYFLKSQNSHIRRLTIRYKYQNKYRVTDSIEFDYQIDYSSQLINRHQADSLFSVEKIKSDY